MMIVRPAALLLAVSAAGPWSLRAQDSTWIRSHYAKFEYQIPMRDGKRLFTAVYAPRDTTQRYPILLTRTPYSIAPYGPDAYRRGLGPGPRFAEEGFIFVYQDVRGRYLSEGDFVHMAPQREAKSAGVVDESTDAYDTVDWLVGHVPRNNGRVGIWGVSYSGFFTAAGMIDAHPALKAASPQAPQADWFMGDDVHHHGAFFLASAFNFFAVNGRLRPVPTSDYVRRFTFGTWDGYQYFLRLGPLPNADTRYFKGAVPFWNDMMSHESYDAFWKARNLLPHLKAIKPAVLAVSGWYDANNLYGALHVYQSVAQQSPGTSNRLVVGPWSHGQWGRGDGDKLGDLEFGSKTGMFFRDSVELPFFDAYLKGNGDVALPKAVMFETGSNRWRTFGEWPPANGTPKELYLRAGGKLSFDTPTGADRSDFDEYVSDPARPVPFNARLGLDMEPDYMARDQRFAANRPDVLVYQTDPLAEDVTIAGSIAPSLQVSTSGTDSDWIVKLIDVYPDSLSGTPDQVSYAGFQQLVRGDVMRGKFRNSYERPEPFIPGAVSKIEFGTDDVLHTFLKGHRIMVQIQSTWFPLVDRNPQKFVDIYRAAASDFQKATQRVYHSPRYASHLKMLVLPR
ncbi:MAG: CocE/NonD family hydrolase [Gemmatimonadetes bacterium]|nr:CocE/NonD family hydrolase [Gemmatimonadota bacterium]